MRLDPDHMSEPLSRRSFVFLQGPTSSVFRDLGRTLSSRGHDVVKINICPGDWVFWHGSDTLWFRGTPEDWPVYLRNVLQIRNATDIIYFSDRFPYHLAAQIIATEMGVRPVSMEYGYLRPDWLILEEGGQSAYSHFPNDPDQLQAVATGIPATPTDPIYKIPEAVEALCETTFHLSNAFTSWLVTPHYAPERYYPVLREYTSYIPRMIRRAVNASKANAAIDHLKSVDAQKYLVPLQMQNDSQLRDNAPAGYQSGFVRDVMNSFRDAAPLNSQLIFKLHPMDNGLERWDRFVPEMARETGIADRVHFLDGGDLTDLFSMVDGCIVINSTMGLRALQSGLPTKAMGVAIYDIKGLTHQGSLDDFWTTKATQNAYLLEMFIRALAHGIHVRGTVYGASGRSAFVDNAILHLEAETLHRHGLYVAIPPRMDCAKRKGIHLHPLPREQLAV